MVPSKLNIITFSFYNWVNLDDTKQVEYYTKFGSGFDGKKGTVCQLNELTQEFHYTNQSTEI